METNENQRYFRKFIIISWACVDFHPLKWMARVPKPSRIDPKWALYEKYVGTVVRKSSQLIIDELIDHFENKIPVQKKPKFP